MDITEILELLSWLSVTDLIPRLITPYLVIALFKLVLREKFRLNVSYFALALVMNFYFCFTSIPVVGVYEQIKTDLFFFSMVSFIYILCWWGLNTLFFKLIRKR